MKVILSRLTERNKYSFTELNGKYFSIFAFYALHQNNYGFVPFIPLNGEI